MTSFLTAFLLHLWLTLWLVVLIFYKWPRVMKLSHLISNWTFSCQQPTRQDNQLRQLIHFLFLNQVTEITLIAKYYIYLILSANILKLLVNVFREFCFIGILVWHDYGLAINDNSLQTKYGWINSNTTLGNIVYLFLARFDHCTFQSKGI